MSFTLSEPTISHPSDFTYLENAFVVFLNRVQEGVPLDDALHQLEKGMCTARLIWEIDQIRTSGDVLNNPQEVAGRIADIHREIAEILRRWG